MSFEVFAIPPFNRQLKRLAKKYPSIGEDIAELGKQLAEEPTTGTALGNNCFKIRLAIKSKAKGKSSGARVITCVRVTKESVYLLTIYDKSEQESLSDKELNSLLEILEESV